MKKSRIQDLPQQDFSKDCSLVVDGELSGTCRMDVGDLVDGIQLENGTTDLEYSDDPTGDGFIYRMTTKFQDAETGKEYVDINIKTPPRLSAGVSSVALPAVLDISATSFFWNTLKQVVNSSNYFNSYLCSYYQISSNAGSGYLPVLHPTQIDIKTNQSYHIVSKVAMLSDLGMTEIYSGNPFEDTMDVENYAFAGKRIDVDFSQYTTVAFLVTVDVKPTSPKLYLTRRIRSGFSVNDVFTTADGFQSGADRSVLDPDSEYGHLSGNSNGYYLRNDYNGLDYIFPSDFMLSTSYDSNVLGGYYSDSFSQSGNVFKNGIGLQNRKYSATVLLAPKTFKIQRRKSSSESMTYTYAKDFQTIRPYICFNPPQRERTNPDQWKIKIADYQLKILAK